MQINLTKWFNFFFVSALLWLLLEGVFRKWLIPSLATPLFAIKYVLFGLTYLTYFITKPYLPKIRYLFQLILVLFLVYAALHTIYNPLKVSLLVTVFGYINYFFFVPLILIVPAYFNSLEKIERLIDWMVWLAIPMLVLGIIQYYSPPDSFINTMVNEEQKLTKIGEFTRTVSVFTFVKIFNVYLLFLTTLLIGNIFYRLNKNKSVLVQLFVLFLAVLNMFMTASRLPIGLMFLFIAIIGIYIFLNIPNLRKTIAFSLVIGVFLFLSLYFISGTYKTAIDKFIFRAEMIETVAEKGREGYSYTERINERITAFKYSQEAGWFGFGIGTTYQGTGMVLVNHREDVPFEEEGERIVLEIGIIGGILTLLLRWSIAIIALFWLTKIRSINLTIFILPLILLILPPILFMNNTTFNFLDSFTYWFAFSLIISLKNLYLKENI